MGSAWVPDLHMQLHVFTNVPMHARTRTHTPANTEIIPELEFPAVPEQREQQALGPEWAACGLSRSIRRGAASPEVRSWASQKGPEQASKGRPREGRGHPAKLLGAAPSQQCRALSTGRVLPPPSHQISFLPKLTPKEETFQRVSPVHARHLLQRWLKLGSDGHVTATHA